MKRGLVLLLAVVCILSFCGSSLASENYPNKPITIVVPWGVGGMTDVTARLLAEKFKAEFGQQVMVLNKPGANGAIGLKYALGQDANGYTLVVGPATDLLVGPYFLGTEPFDPKELSFVGSYMPQERVLFTTPDKPYKTFQEFIEYARKHPGEVSVGSGGLQWALEVMKSVAVKEGLKMKYVMFKSGGEASTAILGKHVDVCETGTGTPAYQAARDGKLTLLVSLSAGKVPFFPDTKNLKEMGYPYNVPITYGLLMRAGTPEPIRKKLEQTLKKIIDDPETREKITGMGLTPQFTDGKTYEKICIDAINSVSSIIEYNKKVQ